MAQAFYAAAIADEVLVGARLEHRGRARDADQRARPASRRAPSPRSTSTAPSWRWCAPSSSSARRATAASQAYRALATLIQMPTGPFRRASQSERRAPPTDEPDLRPALQLRPEFRALEAAAAVRGGRTPRAYAWRWAPSLSAFGNARKFNYDNFSARPVLVGGGRAARLGALRRWHARRAAPPGRRAGRGSAGAGGVFARQRPRRPGQRARPARDEAARRRRPRRARSSWRRETIELVRTQYEAGTVTQVDLLQAQDGLVGAAAGAGPGPLRRRRRRPDAAPRRGHVPAQVARELRWMIIAAMAGRTVTAPECIVELARGDLRGVGVQRLQVSVGARWSRRSTCFGCSRR